MGEPREKWSERSAGELLDEAQARFKHIGDSRRPMAALETKLLIAAAAVRAQQDLPTTVAYEMERAGNLLANQLWESLRSKP